MSIRTLGQRGFNDSEINKRKITNDVWKYSSACSLKLHQILRWTNNDGKIRYRLPPINLSCRLLKKDFR